MRNIITCLTLSLLLATACQPKPELPQKIIEQLSPEQYAGQWLVINYWAEWCKPCIEEIPELNLLNQESHVTVIGINYDGLPPETLAAAMEKLSVDFTVPLQDPAQTLGYDRPKVLPTTLVFSPDGKRIATLVGPQTHASLLAMTKAGSHQ